MDRSWDYLLKTPAMLVFAIIASLMVMTFIVMGGIFMRLEMRKQHLLRQPKEEPADLPNS